jgi:hypothetical protein
MSEIRVIIDCNLAAVYLNNTSVFKHGSTETNGFQCFYPGTQIFYFHPVIDNEPIFNSKFSF